MPFKRKPKAVGRFKLRSGSKGRFEVITPRIEDFSGYGGTLPLKSSFSRKRKCLERDLQTSICKHMCYYPKIYQMMTASAAGEKRNQLTGAILKRMGLKRGWPDLQIMVSNGKHHGFFCELKSPGKVPTSEQKQVLTSLNDNGYYACWADSLDVFFTHVRTYFGPHWERKYA